MVISDEVILMHSVSVILGPESHLEQFRDAPEHPVNKSTARSRSTYITCPPKTFSLDVSLAPEQTPTLTGTLQSAEGNIRQDY